MQRTPKEARKAPSTPSPLGQKRFKKKGSGSLRAASVTPERPRKQKGFDERSPSPAKTPTGSTDKPKAQRTFKRFGGKGDKARKKISLRRSDSQEASFRSLQGNAELTDFGEAIKFNGERNSLEFRLDGLMLQDGDVLRLIDWLRENLEGLLRWYREQIAQFGKKGKGGNVKQKSVANLYLQENRITDVGIKALLDYISTHASQFKDSKEEATQAEESGKEAPPKGLTFRRFFFFKNFISDEGASRVAQFIQESKTPLFEVHLSHNRISTEGALSIFKAVKESKLYPTRGECNPLWLRLEYNYVSSSEALEKLASMGICYCPAIDRQVCSSGKCSNKASTLKPLLHLYVFDMQYKMVEQSERLQNAKKAGELARRERKTPTKQTLVGMSPEPSKRGDKGKDITIGGASMEGRGNEVAADVSVPTYLFLDTNTVIWMISGIMGEKASGEGGKNGAAGGFKGKKPGKGDNNSNNKANTNNNVEKKEKKEGGWNGKLFTFQNLVAKAKRAKFGECFATEGDRVCLVITDTVMQELDHLKFSTPKLARRISKLQSDTGYLAQCAQLHFLEMLGAHQGEQLVAMTTGQIVAGVADVGLLASPSSLRNDRRIIDVALLWNAEIGVTGSVIFLTNDTGAMETAKRHNLPSVSVDEIDRNLKNIEADVAWTASVIKRCMPQAGTYAGRAISQTPIKPIRSVYSEIEAAINLVGKLVTRIEYLERQPPSSCTDQTPGEGKQEEGEKEKGADDIATLAAGSPESFSLLREAMEHMERWAALVESQQVRPYSSSVQQKKKLATVGGETQCSSTEEGKEGDASSCAETNKMIQPMAHAEEVPIELIRVEGETIVGAASLDTPSTPKGE